MKLYGVVAWHSRQELCHPSETDWSYLWLKTESEKRSRFKSCFNIYTTFYKITLVNILYRKKFCLPRDKNPIGRFLPRVPSDWQKPFQTDWSWVHNLSPSLGQGSARRFWGFSPQLRSLVPDYLCMTDAVYFSKVFWSKSYLIQNVTQQCATSKLLFWWMLKHM